MNQYIKFTEIGGDEGADYDFFVLYRGNENTIDRLKFLIDKFCDLNDDWFIKYSGELFDEPEVDVLLKHNKYNKLPNYNKIDKKISSNLLYEENMDKEMFQEFAYEGALFC